MGRTCSTDGASSCVKTATFPNPPTYLPAFNQTFTVAETINSLKSNFITSRRLTLELYYVQ